MPATPSFYHAGCKRSPLCVLPYGALFRVLAFDPGTPPTGVVGYGELAQRILEDKPAVGYLLCRERPAVDKLLYRERVDSEGSCRLRAGHHRNVQAHYF